MTPLVLDLDDSVRGLPDAARIKMGDWQEALRFGCSSSVWRTFRADLETLLPTDPGQFYLPMKQKNAPHAPFSPIAARALSVQVHTPPLPPRGGGCPEEAGEGESSSEQAMTSMCAIALPTDYNLVFLGSGDFHHLSCLLLERQRQHNGLHVLVCDNHPDNMRFPFGIHCGSWVSHAASLPHVARIDVVGICSPDVGWRHAWENRLRPLYRGRVRYWTIGVNTGWTRALGSDVARNFADAASLVSALTQELSGTNAPLYLSIDKDVLHESVARTNWDQGQLLLDDLLGIVAAARPRLVGCDITGEVSVHRYQTRWKRLLSAMDNQPAISPNDLAQWQQQQLVVNQALLQTIG